MRNQGVLGHKMTELAVENLSASPQSAHHGPSWNAKLSSDLIVGESRGEQQPAERKVSVDRVQGFKQLIRDLSTDGKFLRSRAGINGLPLSRFAILVQEAFTRYFLRPSLLVLPGVDVHVSHEGVKPSGHRSLFPVLVTMLKGFFQGVLKQIRSFIFVTKAQPHSSPLQPRHKVNYLGSEVIVSHLTVQQSKMVNIPLLVGDDGNKT